jgi:hypothetical protein
MNKENRLTIIEVAIVTVILFAVAIVGVGISVNNTDKFNFGNNSAFAVNIEDPSFNLSHINTTKLKNYFTAGLTNYSITNNLINMKFRNSGNYAGSVLYSLISLYNSLNYSVKLNFTGTPFNSSNVLYGYLLINSNNQQIGGNTSYYYVHDNQYPNGTILTINNSSPLRVKGNGSITYLGSGYPIFKNETISIPPHEIIQISVSGITHSQTSCAVVINNTTFPNITSENISI